jgi:hypothetical protein
MRRPWWKSDPPVADAWFPQSVTSEGRHDQPTLGILPHAGRSGQDDAAGRLCQVVTDFLETHYTRSADGTNLAYQVSGVGPHDLVFVYGRGSRSICCRRTPGSYASVSG